MAFEEKVIRCTKCGGPVVNLNPRAQTAVCTNCCSQLDLTSPDYKILGHFRKTRLNLPIEVGWSGKYDGEEIRVVGHIRYAADGDKWDEFMLLSEGGRTLWLQVDEGNPTLMETITPLEVVVPESIGHSVTINGKKSNVNDRGFARIVRIDGELSWIARKDDSVGYIDTPDYSIEYMQEEIEIYEKTKITWEELKEIFGKLNTSYTGSLNNNKSYKVTNNGQGIELKGKFAGVLGCLGIFIFIVLFIALISMVDSCGGRFGGGRSNYSSSFGGK